jgi:DNA-binding MarR family transcriptional regulator
MLTTAATSAGPAAGEPGQAGPRMLYLVKQLELAVRSHLDNLLRPSGLTALQYTALTVLERHPDLSTAELARDSFVTAQSMADMITALEGRGLIERHRDRADRRRLVVALTAAGRELLDQYRDQVDALEQKMLAGLTKPQVASLRRSLRACHGNLGGRSRGLPLGSDVAGGQVADRQVADGQPG